MVLGGNKFFPCHIEGICVDRQGLPNNEQVELVQRRMADI